MPMDLRLGIPRRSSGLPALAAPTLDTSTYSTGWNYVDSGTGYFNQPISAVLGLNFLDVYESGVLISSDFPFVSGSAFNVIGLSGDYTYSITVRGKTTSGGADYVTLMSDALLFIPFDADARDYLDDKVLPYVSQTSIDERAESNQFVARKEAGIYDKTAIFPHWWNNATANAQQHKSASAFSWSGTVTHSSDRIAFSAAAYGNFNRDAAATYIDPEYLGWFGWHYGLESGQGFDFGAQIGATDAILFAMNADGSNSGGYTAGFGTASFAAPSPQTNAIHVMYRNGTLQAYRRYVAGTPTVVTSRNDISGTDLPTGNLYFGSLNAGTPLTPSARNWRMSGVITDAMSTTELDDLADILEALKTAKGKS